jgi:quinol monooxygenase YgiN
MTILPSGTIIQNNVGRMSWICCSVLFLMTSLCADEYSIEKCVQGENMSEHVFVVSEWLPREGKDQELWQLAKKLMALTLKEKGCVRAHATRQISHPGAPGNSKYTIICLQEYRSLTAFEAHCASDYVTDFFQTFVLNKDHSIVEDWTCRLFSEEK